MADQEIEGWPPQEGGPGRGGGDGGGGGFRRIQGGGHVHPVVRVAAAVFVAMAVFGAVMAFTGRMGVAMVEAEEVGVKVNYITGSSEVITEPGYKLYIPFVEEVYNFDKTFQQFTMEGDVYRTDNHVPLLDVRASDGSNFRIDNLTIIYEIISGEADVVLHDSGPGTGFKEEWIKAYARSVLRDEFGRYTAVQVADPTVYKQAPVEAADRLNEILESHGIRIVRINTPNPEFDREYERAIEERKEADQEVERLIAEAARLVQLRAQRLAAVDKEKEVEQQRLNGDLAKALLAAQERQILIQKEADVFATKRIAEGQAVLQELTNQARGLEAKYSKEAEGIESRAQALAERGEVVVREAIVDKLLSIDFTLVPYSRDPQPDRLEHSGARTVAEMSADQGGH